MKIKNTVVNSNENSLFLGSAYYGEDDTGCSNMRKLKYRELARRLIDKYWNSPFKHIPNNDKYEFIEFRLVNEFDLADRFYNPDPDFDEIIILQLNMIADALEINPLFLYNDPNLPFFLKVSSQRG